MHLSKIDLYLRRSYTIDNESEKSDRYYIRYSCPPSNSNNRQQAIAYKQSKAAFGKDVVSGLAQSQVKGSFGHDIVGPSAHDGTQGKDVSSFIHNNNCNGPPGSC